MTVDISVKPIAKVRSEDEGKTRQLQKNEVSWKRVVIVTFLFETELCCTCCTLSNVTEVQSLSFLLYTLRLILLFRETNRDNT